MKYVLSLILLISIQVKSQKVIHNEIDKFTKQHRVKTDRILIKGGFTTNMYVGFRAVDSTCFLMVGGTGEGADSIGEKDMFMFLLDNDSTITCYSTGIQDYSIDVSSGITSKSYLHQYSINLDDVKQLATHNLKSIRKYGANGYVDIDVKGKNSDKLTKEAIPFF
jgi:hypothetical protein